MNRVISVYGCGSFRITLKVSLKLIRLTWVNSYEVINQQVANSPARRNRAVERA